MTSLRRMANVDGTVTPLDEARISVLDRGFLYGDSVYEVFRTYDGVPLCYEEHLDRLENSARLIHMRMTQSRRQLTDEIRRTVHASGATDKDVYVRYHVTRGAGPVDLFPRPDLTTSYVIMVKEVPPWNPEFYTSGVRLAIPSVRRNARTALDPNIKSGNYLNNILALTEAVKRDSDDCLMLNEDGLVSESSNSNVFFLMEDRLLTPSQMAGNLRGITKASITQACARRDLPVHEVDIPVADVSRARECFLTSATREVMPVSSVQLESGALVKFPPGGGAVTQKVSRCYREFVHRYVQEHQHLNMRPPDDA